MKSNISDGAILLFMPKIALLPLKLFVTHDWSRNLSNGLKALQREMTREAARLAA